MSTDWPQSYSLDSVTYWVCEKEGIPVGGQRMAEALAVTQYSLEWWSAQGYGLYGKSSGEKYLTKQCVRYVMEQMRPPGWYGFVIWPLLWSAFISAIVQRLIRWLRASSAARRAFGGFNE